MSVLHWSNPSPEQKENRQHNWLYSFMPAHDLIYLVGYCKNCHKSFSEWIPHNQLESTVTEMYFPKWDCEPLEYDRVKEKPDLTFG